MSKEDFISKYKGKRRQALNKCIRAEYPNGNAVLDGLEKWRKIRVRKIESESLEELDMAEQVEAMLHEMRDSMVADILDRYGF